MPNLRINWDIKKKTKQQRSNLYYLRSSSETCCSLNLFLLFSVIQKNARIYHFYSLSLFNLLASLPSVLIIFLFFSLRLCFNKHVGEVTVLENHRERERETTHTHTHTHTHTKHIHYTIRQIIFFLYSVFSYCYVFHV